MARNFAHNGTNRLSIFQSDKVFNKLDNKLQSLNIETCERYNFKNTCSSNYLHQNVIFKFASTTNRSIGISNTLEMMVQKTMSILKITNLQ